MTFSFRFEALRTYRAHRKERAEVELGRAQKRLRQARDELEGDRSRLRETGREIQASLKEGAPSDLLKSQAEFVSGLESRIENHKKEIIRRKAEVQERRAEVLARTREARIVEKLKERDYEAWLQVQKRQEQKALDEMAVIRHGRAFA